MHTHERFQRKVWAFPSDLTGALAKWLVKQSPYTVPDNLQTCLEKFEALVKATFAFNSNKMIEIDLSSLTKQIEPLLEQIPEVMALNNRKNKREGNAYVSRCSPEIDPDDDFICIGAVAQNITCEFAERADAESYLDR